MARGAFVLISMMLAAVSGCNSDATPQALSQTDDGGALESGTTGDTSTTRDTESGSVVDMPNDTDAPMPTCSDGIQNGDESDVDCGGFCSPCALGKACRAHSDCSSVHCIDTKCQVCAPGSSQCAGNKPSTCVNGDWVVAADDCASGCDLNTGKCVAGSE